MSNKDVDPAYIKDVENWDSLSHQDIWNHVQNMKPGIMHGHGKTWMDISAGLGGALFGLNLSIQRHISEGFHGQFANAASDSARKFVQQGTGVQEVIESVGTRIHAAGYGAEAVKGSVPPPSGATGAASAPQPTSLAGLMLPGIPDPQSSVDGGKESQALYEEAKAAMTLNYVPTYEPAGQNVPTFVPVAAPGDGPGAPGDGTQSGPGPNGPGGSAGGHPNSTGGEPKPAGGSDKPGSDASRTDPSGTSGNPQAGHGSDQPGVPAPSSPAGAAPDGSTHPSGLDSTTPAGFGGSSSGPDVGSHGGIGVPGGVSGGGASQSGGVPGRSLPGTPGGTNPAAAAAALGKPGQPGFGGMPGLGASPKKAEDKEHKSPDYLVTDREEELIGIQDRTTPQAIGADIPAAQPQPNDSGRKQ
ncbi:MAG: hypothetical protein J2P18_03725 [Nocardia sp.]|nr:hypothetical protein [Nocardia sp.]